MPGKKGHNKGIAATKKAHKRAEAEARNAKTPVERTRKFRLNSAPYCDEATDSGHSSANGLG